MTHSLRTHRHGGGKAIVHVALIAATAIAVMIGFALLAVVTFFAVVAISSGSSLAAAIGFAVLALVGVLVFLYFRWALK